MTNDALKHQKTPAVFLDRDGTLIEDRGNIQSPEEVIFFEDTIQALQRLQQTFKLFIVTNQPGIAAGAITPAEVDRVNKFILGHLAQFDIQIERVYCCPHRRTDGCHCIKPKPYFLQEAARTYGIDLCKSFVIGDHPHDVQLADTVNATGIYLLTGHGEKHRADLQGSPHVVSRILDAANLVLNLHASNNKQNATVQIMQIDEGEIELRYYGNPRDNTYRSWKLLSREAEDLRSWWCSGGSDFDERQSPIRSQPYKSIFVSMIVPTLIEIKMLNEWGKPKTIGCAFPREVVEHLVVWLEGPH